MYVVDCQPYIPRNAVVRVQPRGNRTGARTRCPHAVISITSADDDVARIPRSAVCRGILRVAFADIDVEISGLTPFTAEHAVEILEFVFAHRREVERFVV